MIRISVVFCVKEPMLTFFYLILNSIIVILVQGLCLYQPIRREIKTISRHTDIKRLNDIYDDQSVQDTAGQSLSCLRRIASGNFKTRSQFLKYTYIMLYCKYPVHWKSTILIMPPLPSLVASWIVLTTNPGATSDGIMTSFVLQW